MVNHNTSKIEWTMSYIFLRFVRLMLFANSDNLINLIIFYMFTFSCNIYFTFLNTYIIIYRGPLSIIPLWTYKVEPNIWTYIKNHFS